MSQPLNSFSFPCSTQEFDKKYNPTWHCIVGRNFGSYVTHETKHFIYFYLGQVAILLFKSGWEGRESVFPTPADHIQHGLTPQKALIIPWQGAAAFFCAAFYFVFEDIYKKKLNVAMLKRWNTCIYFCLVTLDVIFLIKSVAVKLFGSNACCGLFIAPFHVSWQFHLTCYNTNLDVCVCVCV